MLRYLNNHPEEFDYILQPCLVALMQASGAMFTEIINIGLLCGQDTIIDSIINFVALGAIA